MNLKMIFEVTKDEDGYHSQYEIIYYEEERVGFCGGDVIKFDCKTLEEAIDSMKGYPIFEIAEDNVL